MGTTGQRPGRIKLGIALAKSSWAVINGDRSLVAFPILGAIFAILAGALLFAPGVAINVADSNATWALAVFGVLAAYAMTFVGIFFAVALAACAKEAMDGADTTVGQGIAASRSRLGTIAGWSLVSLTVGLLLNALQSLVRDQAGSIAGGIVGALGSLAWTVASFFVIPILALEDLGPIDALKRSTKTIKERWGEGVVGTAAIGIVTLPFVIIGVALLFGGFAVGKASVGGAIALVALGVIVFACGMIISGSLNAIFRVVLYRYATDGTVSGGFDEQLLANAFTSRKKPFSR